MTSYQICPPFATFFLLLYSMSHTTGSNCSSKLQNQKQQHQHSGCIIKVTVAMRDPKPCGGASHFRDVTSPDGFSVLQHQWTLQICT
ncbi:hypothetical protein F5Y18DRAFT_397322 [Xylariaceae sp. FL1019]|nr:hypothetical protein F5Y18DRAFT_397322 [Xylariaceae sp. FL1019]